VFNLEITFTGLCLFLSKQEKVHVLMLQSQQHPHLAHLRYDPGYLTSGGTLGAGNTGTVDLANDVPGRKLKLDKYTGSTGSTILPPTIVDISPVATPPLGDDPPLKPKISAIVTLPPGTGSTYHDRGPWEADLKSGGKHTYDLAAWNLIWTVPDIPDAVLTLDKAGPGNADLVLYPKDDSMKEGKWVKLLAYNLPNPITKLPRVPPRPPCDPTGTYYCSHFPDLWGEYAPPAGSLKWLDACDSRGLRMDTTAYSCVPGKGQ
jgi:hypothetical protein